MVRKSDEQPSESLRKWLKSGEMVRYEVKPPRARIELRLPQALLDAIKERARKRGITHAALIRLLIEQEINRR